MPIAPPVIAVLQAVPSVLAAVQAGGGGSFGSGGGGGGGFGGGSYGGGGDDGGFVVYLLLKLIFEVPWIGVPLAIFVLFVFLKSGTTAVASHQQRTIKKSRPRVALKRGEDAVRALRSVDPSFEAEPFLRRVDLAFRKAQDAWCAQDLAPLRPFTSDGVYERFSLQISEQVRDGWRQELEDLRVDKPTMLHVELGRRFDAVTVRIPFTAKIHRVSRETGKRRSAETLPETRFTECWTFLRRRGAKSLSGDGLIEGQCPNCGAPIALVQSAKCAQCDAFVRSGQHDWVLTEITQASVWAPEPEDRVPGLAAYAESDPDISLAAIEDRASVVFWRWCASLRRGMERRAGIVPAPDPDAEPEAALPAGPLRKVATDAYCDGLDRALESEDFWYLADAAVGSVRTLGVLAGEERDRVVVEVHWDGRRASVDADGTRTLKRERRMRRTLFVFGRKAGQRSLVEQAFTATNCQSCGAADDGSLAALCAYCGAPRTGDDATWLLEEVRAGSAASELREELRALAQAQSAAVPTASVAPVAPAASNATPPPSQPAPPPPPAEGLLGWAAGVLRADGEIRTKERAAFESLASGLGLRRDRVEALLTRKDSRDALGDPGGLEPRDEAEARVWLAALVEVALADGALHARERKLLVTAADRLGLARSEVGKLIGVKRGELYREARRA